MQTFKISELQSLLSETKIDKTLTNSLQPLFANEQEYAAWKENRNVKCLRRCGLDPQAPEKKKCLFLGIDSGSTTTKILILDGNENIVFTYYAANQGNSLQKIVEGLQEFETEYGSLQNISASCSTGYGEELIKQAFNLNFGIVETMAHLQGAQWINPDVSFVLDIGGQDMKSIFVQDGVIANIELNEACSSGCGSFLQNFAATMNLSLSEFTQAACLAQNPADLGTRCTVFMNSKVKQSLRENATIGDIAAGLAYSVVKNCLFKVLKISNLNALGDNIVVQGGTFRNDAVYRALEILSGKSVSSTDMPEMMGALGAALYAKNNYELRIKNYEQNRFQFSTFNSQLKYETKELNCKGCTNQCSVLKFTFENGNVCYSGNKCEKIFFSKSSAKTKAYNAFEEKNEILFAEQRQDKNIFQFSTFNSQLKIGIPRILNMYENFPFWKTLFENCGFEVVLSPESTMELYKKGVSSVMSDNICFPAKLAHGHILALAQAKVDRIFYPIVPKEDKDFQGSNNSYNCPVVSGYPEVIRSAMNPESNFGIPFDKPVMNFENEKMLKKQCFDYISTIIAGLTRNPLKQEGIAAFAGMTTAIFNQAFEKADFIRKNYNHQFIENQKNILDKSIKSGELTFVVAGRPYHADLLVNQKIGQIISDLGVNVLTDDVFRNGKGENFFAPVRKWQNLNFVSQWSYPNRVMQAAMQVAKLPQNIQLLQLNSFGCGPDSFLLDEVGAILQQAGKNHTVLRIDEISSSGSIRLRLRSFIESINQLRIKN